MDSLTFTNDMHAYILSYSCQINKISQNMDILPSDFLNNHMTSVKKIL